MEKSFFDCALNDVQLSLLKHKNVAAVRYAEGGAMGIPGEIVVYFVEEGKAWRSTGNFLYGGVDFEKLKQKLKLSDQGEKGWQEFYMGMGNHLLLNKRDFSKLISSFEGITDEETLWRTYEDLILEELQNRAEKQEQRQRKDIVSSLLSSDEEDYDGLGFTISVYLELPKGEHLYFPDCNRIYLNEMDNTPDDWCVEKKLGWDKRICVKKSDFALLIKKWYPQGVPNLFRNSYMHALSQIEDDVVCIYGWGD